MKERDVLFMAAVFPVCPAASSRAFRGRMRPFGVTVYEVGHASFIPRRLAAPSVSTAVAGRAVPRCRRCCSCAAIVGR